MFDVGVGRMEEGWSDDDVEVLEASDTGGAADGWGRGRTCLRRGNRVTGHVRGFLISSKLPLHFRPITWHRSWHAA
jgi:hypothetical protein